VRDLRAMFTVISVTISDVEVTRFEEVSHLHSELPTKLSEIVGDDIVDRLARAVREHGVTIHITVSPYSDEEMSEQDATSDV
jgi:ParB-like chromosome segregation protein Spo0J